MLAYTAIHDATTVEVTVITTLGLIIVAIIGVYTAKVTSGARQDAKDNADEALKSANIAKDYAAALDAKNALIESMNSRLVYVEQHDKECTGRLEELERRAEEADEQRRSFGLLEREHHREISQLRDEVERLEKLQIKRR